MLALNLVQTIALAGVVLFFGHWLRRVIPVLARLNLPAPVVGGLPVALVMSLAQLGETTLVTFDLTLRDPLMIAFFTSIGFGASVAMLRRGGPAVTLSAEPGELLLFLFGRQAHARVELTGPEEITARMRTARYGI